jgi:PLD-like domain
MWRQTGSRASWRGPIAVLLALGLAAGCSSHGGYREPGRFGDQAAAESSRVRPGLYPARPTPEGSEIENTTLRRLVELIAQTPTGETIRVVAHSFSFLPVADALVDANERGVRVQVLADESVSGRWEASARLREALGTDRSKPSFLYLTPGALHQKTWSFTRTGRSRDVVIVGSENLTYESARQFTDVYAYVGRRGVRRVFDRRFDELVAGLPRPDRSRPIRLGKDKVWFYPLAQDVGDPVLNLLRDLPAEDAVVRVAMYAWLHDRGLAITAELARLRREGADVQVVLGRSVAERQRAALATAGIPMHPGVFGDGDNIHHKLTLVSYRGDDGRLRRFVLTGSDNFTGPSLQRPEMLLRIDADRGPLWDRYVRWFDRLVTRGEQEAREG